MSKFKITVENTETGNKRSYDGDFYSVFAKRFGDEAVTSATEGKTIPLEVVKILLSMDYVKEILMKDRPDIRIGYAMHETLFSPATVVDLEEMRRQAGKVEED